MPADSYRPRALGSPLAELRRVRDPDDLGVMPVDAGGRTRRAQQTPAVGPAPKVLHPLSDQPALQLQVQHGRLLSTRQGTALIGKDRLSECQVLARNQ